MPNGHYIQLFPLCCAAVDAVFRLLFLLGRTPEKAIFENYLRSRRIMGVAMLLLAANYSVHFFMKVRFNDADAAILMNLSTYFLCYWLFSSAFTTLLDRNYITGRRLLTHISLWILFSAISCIVLKLLPGGKFQTVSILVLAVCLVAYGLLLTWRLLRTYHVVLRMFDATHSDDIGAYIRWLSVVTYWAVIFGVGCGLLTFLPDRYVYIWILMSIPFYIYLFLCYLNYLLFYEQVEGAMETYKEDDRSEPEPTQETPSYHAEIAEKIKGWINADGYVRTGLTIKDLSEQLHTNRTYLSEYINTTYGVSFRDWITGLRIDYAKRLLVQYPKLTLADISERSGFLSPSHFIRLFKEKPAVLLQNGENHSNVKVTEIA